MGPLEKGRSSSWRLNRRMKRSFFLCLCGGFELFVCWVGTDVNPADAPSSVYGLRAKGVEVDPEKVHDIVVHPERWVPSEGKLILHLCSGARRDEYVT